MRRGLAYWIWAFFAICLPRKKLGFLPRTPLPPPPIEPYNFLCEMAPYVEICYAYSGGAEGVPAQKFGLFVTAGGPTAASSADRLLAHTQQAFTDTPKKQQNNDRRCSDFDYNQSYARIVNVVNGMVSGQRSTLGTGLSGEPRFAWLGSHPSPATRKDATVKVVLATWHKCSAKLCCYLAHLYWHGARFALLGCACSLAHLRPQIYTAKAAVQASIFLASHQLAGSKMVLSRDHVVQKRWSCEVVGSHHCLFDISRPVVYLPSSMPANIPLLKVVLATWHKCFSKLCLSSVPFGPTSLQQVRLHKINNFGTATKVDITRWLRKHLLSSSAMKRFDQKRKLFSKWRSLIFGWHSSFACFTIQCPREVPLQFVKVLRWLDQWY